MKRLYASPLRVYLVLAVLAFLGIWASTRLPVSLFPKSSQPRFHVGYAYSSLSAQEFKRLYGDLLESSLQGVKTPEASVERVEVTYGDQYMSALVNFSWGSDPDVAQREINLVLGTAAAAMPEDIRRSQSLWSEGGEGSMFAVSFSSSKRSIDELHRLLEPLLVPEIRRLPDVGSSQLFNPNGREIRLKLRPEVLAQLNLTTLEVENALSEALTSRTAGSLETEAGSQPVEVPRAIKSVSDLEQLVLPLGGGRTSHLSELAQVSYERARGDTEIHKLNGAPTILLIANPKPSANLKRMADEAGAVVQRIKASLPPDISVQVVLDPAAFIGSAVNNVLKEVALGSFLAAAILLLFIGNLRNVMTAAIEIPISIALAFLVMWICDMNLNLLSLAGLALAAGMNVDASVVVMENIFRHFEGQPRNLSRTQKLAIMVAAVKEVRTPVIASNVASLVVFVPFMFTSGLSYAILGDLAKAVIFSHGFSAVVALVLVPTVRLQLMRGGQGGGEHKALADRPLHWLEERYAGILRYLTAAPRRALVLLGLPILLLGLGVLKVFPELPREIVGKPEADFLGVQINVEGFNNMNQMESFVASFQHDIKAKLPEMQGKVKFTLDMIQGPNRSISFFKLKNKRDMPALHAAMEKAFPSGQGRFYAVFEWNPSEFQLPQTYALRVAIHGGEAEDRTIAARDLKQKLEGLRLLQNIESSPNLERASRVQVKIDPTQYALLVDQGLRWSPSSLSDALRTASVGKWIGQLPIEGRDTSVRLEFTEGAVAKPADIEAFPLNLGGKILPLKALATVEESPIQDRRYSENGQEMLLLSATLPQEKIRESSRYESQLREVVETWRDERLPELGLQPLAVSVLEANRDLADSLSQLQLAFLLSVFLLFLAIVFQFGSFGEATLVLLAVPLGLLGAVLSLALCQSTLSVNAVLGMILLNGIAVNNSIILVDFAKKLHREGLGAAEAVIAAARKRLRPILITTLTTMLAMLPVASGYGEGGRVLQPLGIAVVGGLWLSTLLTLLLVPLLQASLLKWQAERRPQPSQTLKSLALAQSS